MTHTPTPTGDDTTTFDDALAEQVVSVCRTTVGDGLRSVVLFTREEEDIVYLRSDLASRGEAVRTVKETFVENERLGFDSKETYRRFAEDTDSVPDIGRYEFTIRVFEDGFVSRVIVGDHGVLLTTDDIDVDAFEDMAVALRGLLAE